MLRRDPGPPPHDAHAALYPEDPRREGAFLWNYAGMNVGFFIGFSVFATVGNFVAIILALLNWNTLTARKTEEAGSLRR